MQSNTIITLENLRFKQMNDSRLTHEFYNCGKKMNNKLYNLKARFVCIIIKLGIIMNDQIMTGNPTAIAHQSVEILHITGLQSLDF